MNERRMRMPAALAALLAVVLAGCNGDDTAPAPPAAEPAGTVAPAAPVAPAAGPTYAAPEVDLPPGVTAEMVTAGGALYHGQGICFSCHGQEGAGGPLGPPLNDSDWIALGEGDFEEIVTVIRTGVPRPTQYPAPMPPMGGASLSEEQLRQVSAYVYALSRGE
jgi:mono/diheme cytochrome c family protein